MEQLHRIPVYRTFINWILTVITGSILFPIVNGEYNSGFLEVIFISMIASSMYSLPAVLVMFFAHILLNKYVKNRRNHQLLQNSVHLFVIIITFGVLACGFGEDTKKLFPAIVIAYSSAGLFIWNMTYWMYGKKKNADSDLMDEL